MDKYAEFLQTNEWGQLIDPNTKEPISPDDIHRGHVTGMENRGFLDFASKSGMSQKELNNTVNNAGLYQYESGSSNMSHEFEEQDRNQTSLNTAAYCYFENHEYMENVFINPPSDENGEWTLSVVNKETGVETIIGNFNPDTGLSSGNSANNDNNNNNVTEESAADSSGSCANNDNTSDIDMTDDNGIDDDDNGIDDDDNGISM